MPSDEYLDREQSQIKHFALGKYLEVAALILGHSKNVAYIDCCAGPWNARTVDLSDTSFGIATGALAAAHKSLASKGKNSSFRALLIESAPEPYRQLKSFADHARFPGLTVTAKNWDFSQRLGEIIEFARAPRTFPFTFIDPKGWKLAQLNVIRPLLELNPGEVLINLMSSFVTRFVNDANLDFTQLLGPGFSQVRELTGADQEDEVVRRYCDAIRRVGHFPYVCALPIMKADSDAFHFHLIYATRHPLGVKKFKEVERRAEQQTEVIRAEKQQKKREQMSGIRDLFAPEVRYHETRYQRLQEKNKTLAQNAVFNLISARQSVSYDDCWAEAMQYAAVFESDLRSWLLAWEFQERIQISGRKSASERLKTGSHHQILLRARS